MIDNNKYENLSFDSIAVHGYSLCDPYTGAVSTPIYQTSTYRNPGLNSGIRYSYTRCDNPTRTALEETIALLEHGKYGFAFTSGLAAIMTCFSLLRSGDHIVISDDTYGGTYRQSEELWKHYGIEFTAVDVGKLDEIRNALRPNTKMIYIETPTNPMMKVADIAAIAEISKNCGAYLAVDNTFLSPFFQKPLDLGADIIIHSGTKYLAGHNDTMAGFLVVNDDKTADRIALIQRTEGNALAPFDCWLVERGIQTLALRMRRHEENAIKAAEYLKTNKNVEEVFFIGLPDHPSYDITKKQSTGFGGMLSFNIKDASKANDVLTGGNMIMFAESLGGTATLITYPLTQTHASIPKELREKVGITDKLIRLSVGIEDADDIIKDLEKMLNY